MRSIFKESWKKEDPKDLIVLDVREYDASLPPLTRSQIQAWDQVTRNDPKNKIEGEKSQIEVEEKPIRKKRGRKRKIQDVEINESKGECEETKEDEPLKQEVEVQPRPGEKGLFFH